MKKRYKINMFSIVDDNFALDKKRAIEICDGIIKRRLNINWICGQGIRADTIDKKLLTKMKEAGCRLIGIGVETTNPKSMKALKRGITLERIKQAIRETQEVGIILKTFNIIGAPYETFDDVMNTIQFNKDMKVGIMRFSIYLPFPGSELKVWAEKNARMSEKYNPYEETKMIGDITKDSIAYETDYFSFEEKIKTYNIAQREIDKMLIRLFLKRRIGKVGLLFSPLFDNRISARIIKKIYLKYLRGKIEVWD